MALGGQFVIGVHLDAQIGQGVDELDQKGKLVPGILIHMGADEFAFVLFDEVGDAAARQGAFGHDALVPVYAGKFPTFADMFLVGFNFLVGRNLFSAPNDRF